jgi:nitrogenase subunit NifH
MVKIDATGEVNILCGMINNNNNNIQSEICSIDEFNNRISLKIHKNIFREHIISLAPLILA